MKSVRVGVYKLKPGGADEVIRRAEQGMLPIFQQQPGFVAYQVIKTGDDGVVSISTWESHEQAEQAVQQAGAWVKEHMAELTTSVDNYVGDVGFYHRAKTGAHS